MTTLASQGKEDRVCCNAIKIVLFIVSDIILSETRCSLDNLQKQGLVCMFQTISF